MTTAPLTAALVRLAVPRAGGWYYFDRSYCITPDRVGGEMEGMESMRVRWEEIGGDIQIHECQVDERRRTDQPHNWQADCISKAEMAAIVRRIDSELRDERRPTPWTAADEYDSRRKEA